MESNQTPWVKLQDQEAPHGIQVLLRIEGSEGQTSYEVAEYDKFVYAFVQYRIGEGRLNVLRYGGTVTHWMPIPQVPR